MLNLLDIYNSVCTKYKDENECIQTLLSFYSKTPILKKTVDDFLFKSLKENNTINPIQLLQLIGITHQKKKEKNKLYKTNERKHYGIFYTDYAIARLITKKTLNQLNFDVLSNYKFLEPCSGTGIFVIAYIDEVFSRKVDLSQKDAQKIIDNIYCADIDEEAIYLLQDILKLYIKNKYNLNIKTSKNNFYKGNILFKNIDSKIEKNDPKLFFSNTEGFDVVLTNPPYRLLKANGNKYKEGANNNHAGEIAKIISFIKENNLYKYNNGALNYYKIFIEEILENYTKAKARVGLLVPQTLLNDSQSEQLRKNMINNYGIEQIYIIPEKNKFFPDTTQSFCFFALDKDKNTKDIAIIDSVYDKNQLNNKGLKINIETLKQVSGSLPIFSESAIGWQIIRKISFTKKLGELTSVKNLRGELDLTLNKKFITKNKTPFKLLRGINIKEYGYIDSDNYVDENFLNEINGKRQYVLQERIACQQISNLSSDKRLKFTKIPPNHILGNSCNFLTIEKNVLFDLSIDLNYLLAIMNSLLLDWRFKLTSSNNHVSNYELNSLPIFLPNNNQLKEINKIVKTIKDNNDIKNLAKLNIEIFKLYGITKKEVGYILKKYAKNNLTKLILMEI